MKVRVLREVFWSPDGASIILLAPGTLLDKSDPRIAGGFIELATQRGIAELVEADDAAPQNEADRSPGTAQRSPRDTAHSGAPKRKGRKKSA